MRRLVCLLACLAAVSIHAQRPTPAPGNVEGFEVASIRRNASANDGARVSGNGGRLTITNNPLRNIIRNAWTLQDFQIVGGPSWMNTDRWDIVAKAEGNPGPQMMAMLQKLLADRFKLVVHKETRELPIYALTFARPDHSLGPKMQASTTDCQKEMSAAIARGGPPRPNSALLCGIRSLPGHFQLNAAAMSNFVRNLTGFAGRSVVDRTGLTGVYDADLTWNDSDEGPSLFTAMQEQLGLKLEPQRGPVEVLVIDSVERPVED